MDYKYKVNYIDIELQIFKVELFNNLAEANEFAYERVNTMNYDKAIIIDNNGIEVTRYYNPAFIR